MQGERTPVRGLARLLRRNPTEAERVLWQALVNDRRFAGRGFKRQVPVGPHITDFVSFPLKCVIDLVPPQETEEATRTRAERRAYLAARGYRVCEVRAEEVERDVGGVLESLAATLSATRTEAASRTKPAKDDGPAVTSRLASLAQQDDGRAAYPSTP